MLGNRCISSTVVYCQTAGIAGRSWAAVINSADYYRTTPLMLLLLLPCSFFVPHRSMMTDAQKYFVTVEPGVDAAFVVALATLCDEIYNDKE
jgi:hypothetical protein